MGYGTSGGIRMKFIFISTAVMLALLAIATIALVFGLTNTMFAFATAAVLPIAGTLYRLRCNSKFVYGVFELLVAAGFFYFLALGIYRAPYQPLTLELLVSRMLTFFAAIYFMVRALDNIGQGLDGARSLRWKQFFGLNQGEGTR
jgi:hypothetical protein